MGKETERDVDRVEAPSGNGSEGHADVAGEAPPGPAVKVEERRGRDPVIKVLSFLGAIFLFILAIQLMKKGAGAIGPRIQGSACSTTGSPRWGLVGWPPTWSSPARL